MTILYTGLIAKVTGVTEVTIRNAYKDMYTQGPRGGRAELVQGLIGLALACNHMLTKDAFADAQGKGEIVFKIAEGKGVYNLPSPGERQHG